MGDSETLRPGDWVTFLDKESRFLTRQVGEIVDGLVQMQPLKYDGAIIDKTVYSTNRKNIVLREARR